jgi:hypothetical protein
MSVPHRKHITSTLWAQQVNAIYRFQMMVSEYNYHISGHYKLACILLKTRLFGDRILSPSSGIDFLDDPNRRNSLCVRTQARVPTNKTNPVALCPQANYTDWSTVTCRRNLVPTSVERGVSRGQRGGSPTVVNLSFLDRERAPTGLLKPTEHKSPKRINIYTPREDRVGNAEERSEYFWSFFSRTAPKGTAFQTQFSVLHHEHKYTDLKLGAVQNWERESRTILCVVKGSIGMEVGYEMGGGG